MRLEEYKKEPYKLDMAFSDDKLIKIAALTEKNSLFIEAVVRLDSNYSKSSDPKAENDKNFDPIRDVSDAGNNFCGSYEYWLTCIKNSKTYEEYRRAVYGAVVSIDTSNSTHLEACIDGRKNMAEIILSNYQNLTLLKQALAKDFDENDTNHIIYKLSAPLEAAKKKDTLRCNMSFASKFCSYASLSLLGKDIYSKYDSVVSNLLPKYMGVYLNKKTNKKSYKVKTRTHQDWLRVYKNYLDDITNILNCEEVKKHSITREQFDHIIWYCNK